MGAGGTGFPFDIYRRLKALPRAVGVYSYGRHILWPRPGELPYPGGELLIDPTRRYLDTLRRHGLRSMREQEARVRELWHGVPLEPDAYRRVVREMLAETGRCTVLTHTTFRGVEQSGGRIEALVLNDGRRVRARAYVDSTGDARLAAACGCETMYGQESKAAYDEPDAPEKPTGHLNGTTLIYRVTPVSQPRVEPLPEDVPAECWWRASFPVASIVQMPRGDRNVNMLPTMEGRETVDLGEAAYAECRRRVLAHWHHCQVSFPEFRGYRLTWIAPALGIREGRRLVGAYVLTEHDLLAGLSGQRHEDVIAIADHAMDTHGASTGRAGCGELREPYGVPYRCLVPSDAEHPPDNLLVACRAASFSSLAASSCRLSRTMMQLGQAAGTAVALSVEGGVPLPRVPPGKLRAALREQHVQLEWPMTKAVRAVLAVE
jgi:hypothetical protein